ncbi:hypothetical protein SAMN05216228_103941 [Rhizobium tibeticum]|uniref:Uncharacterized protein n=1 Tax=Rhizobium tibeticum TaxID=501024 RepID=A0ABY1AVN2_9HYPH|nr:hypothetical protein SAMN05216228_103941 [Rhizobium tibeticum]
MARRNSGLNEGSPGRIQWKFLDAKLYLRDYSERPTHAIRLGKAVRERIGNLRWQLAIAKEVEFV